MTEDDKTRALQILLILVVLAVVAVAAFRGAP